MPLIDHKGSPEVARIDLIGAEKVEQFDIARSTPGKNPLDIAPIRSRHKPEIESSDARRRMMQDIESVPLVTAEAITFGDFMRHC